MGVKAVHDDLKEATLKLQSLESLKSFSLVGGTNIALKLNHRVSCDIDLFTNLKMGQQGYQKIQQELMDVLEISPEDYYYYFHHGNEQWGASKLQYPLSNGQSVKVDIIDNVQRLDAIETHNGIRCWSLKDVGIQKLIALGGRIHKKDFYDLDAITDKIPLIELMVGLENRLKTYPYPEYDSVLEKDSMGFPTQRSKLLLSYIELYPGIYDDQLGKQVIEPIAGKTWEEAEKSWIQKARQIIYESDRFPQDILNPKKVVRSNLNQKQDKTEGYGY
ncbi:MAG: nucleotidyl transferase AbiEii/AbiGii toxin family protein [Flavobacteriaceae bacterium]|nr:nucleotidyl transferase AbiEii/AbiGii toxin family protein [Flavobacteriaceae bacterium]